MEKPTAYSCRQESDQYPRHSGNQLIKRNHIRGLRASLRQASTMRCVHVSTIPTSSEEGCGTSTRCIWSGPLSRCSEAERCLRTPASLTPAQGKARSPSGATLSGSVCTSLALTMVKRSTSNTSAIGRAPNTDHSPYASAISWMAPTSDKSTQRSWRDFLGGAR
jgi:hypothetical protein